MHTPPTVSTPMRDALLTDIETLWRLLDDLFASFTAQQWARRHGKDWTFADVPYHLCYFDHDIILAAITSTTPVDVVSEYPQPPPDHNAISVWNVEKLAARPANQPVATSLAAMRASRAAIRDAVRQMNDTDLERQVRMRPPFYTPTTVQVVLENYITHTWSHYTELCLRLKRPCHAPISATHCAIRTYMGFFPLMLNRELAAHTNFTMVMEFTGPAASSWTVSVAEGECSIKTGQTDHFDVRMIQSPESFVATMIAVQNPVMAMLTGKIKVKGMGKLSTFGKLFPRPELRGRIIVGAHISAPLLHFA